MQAAKAAKLTPEQLAAQQEEELRKQEEELKLLQKLPRPTMASRTETSVSLNLSRGGKDEVRIMHCFSLYNAETRSAKWVSAFQLLGQAQKELALTRLRLKEKRLHTGI